MIERIYILCLIIIIKSEVWTISHCLGLGHETMVCAVCLSIFLWCSPGALASTMCHWRPFCFSTKFLSKYFLVMPLCLEWFVWSYTITPRMYNYMFLYTNGPHRHFSWLTVAAIFDLCKWRPNEWPIRLCPFLKWFSIKKYITVPNFMLLTQSAQYCVLTAPLWGFQAYASIPTMVPRVSNMLFPCLVCNFFSDILVV